MQAISDIDHLPESTRPLNTDTHMDYTCVRLNGLRESEKCKKTEDKWSLKAINSQSGAGPSTTSRKTAALWREINRLINSTQTQTDSGLMSVSTVWAQQHVIVSDPAYSDAVIIITTFPLSPARPNPGSVWTLNPIQPLIWLINYNLTRADVADDDTLLIQAARGGRIIQH